MKFTSNEWWLLLICSMFLVVIVILVYFIIKNQVGGSHLILLESVGSFFNHVATPIIALVALILTVKINNTLIANGNRMSEIEISNSKRLALMTSRFETFKILKEQFDRVVHQIETTPILAQNNGAFYATIELQSVYRVWDDYSKQFGRFFPDTFNGDAAREFQTNLHRYLFERASEQVKRDILNSYDVLMASLVEETVGASVLVDRVIMVVEENGNVTEYRFNDTDDWENFIQSKKQELSGD